jgi:hypothetical protein
MTLKKLLTVAVSCMALLGSAAAIAGLLYKSTMPDGSVVYSNKPIADAKSVKLVDPRTRAAGARLATPEQTVLTDNLRTSRRQRHQGQLVGKWETDFLKDVYDPDAQFALTVELERKGDGFSGTVREVRGGDSPQVNSAIVEGSIDDDRISFYTQHDTDGAGNPVPYRTMYKGTIQGDRIAFTRYDNHPQGGLSQQFMAVRSKGK